MVRFVTFQAANKAVNTIVHSAKTAFYNAKILACSTSKQLFSVTNTLLGKSDKAPLPSTLPLSELPQCFSDFFTNKIALYVLTLIRSLSLDLLFPTLSLMEQHSLHFILSLNPLSGILFVSLPLRPADLTLYPRLSSLTVLTPYYPFLQLSSTTLCQPASFLLSSNLLSLLLS